MLDSHDPDHLVRYSQWTLLKFTHTHMDKNVQYDQPNTRNNSQNVQYDQLILNIILKTCNRSTNTKHKSQNVQYY